MSEFTRQRTVAKQSNVRPATAHCQGDGSIFGAMV